MPFRVLFRSAAIAVLLSRASGGVRGPRERIEGFWGYFEGRLTLLCVCVCCHFRAPAHAIFAHNLLSC